MKVLCIADSGISLKIKTMLSCYQSFFGRMEDILFCAVQSGEVMPSAKGFDRIVVGEADVGELCRLFQDGIESSKLYLWLFDTMIAFSDLSVLNELTGRFLSAHDWPRVKQINKVKTEINHFLKKAELDTFPSRLQLESTSRCNAQCIMCSHYYAANDGALDMDERMLSHLEALMPYLDIIIMHGNGEPFVSKMFEPCVETYSSYGIKLTTNTNLSILLDRHIELINSAFVNIRVSCDACTKEIYEGIRRNLSFETLTENLRRLRDLCPGVSKTMASVLMRQNIMQLPELVAFAAEYGFEEIILSNLGTSLIVGNEQDNISHYPYLTAIQLRRAIRAGEECGIKVTVPASFDLTLDDPAEEEAELGRLNAEPFFRTESDASSIRELAKSIVGDEYRLIEDLADCYWDTDLFDCEGICEWCIEQPYIDLNGNVFVCCINATYRVGNIFDYDSFLDLWNNDVYKKIRSLFYQGKLPGFCNNCQFILNGSLRRLKVPEQGDAFYRRRRISKFYHDHYEGQGDE